MKPLERYLAPRFPFAAILMAALGGCQDAPSPEWMALADRLEPEPPGRIVTHHPWRADRNVEVVTEGGGATLRIPLRREEWEPVPEFGGVWRVPLELRVLVKRGLDTLQLSTPQGPVPRTPAARLATERQPGFTYRNGFLVLGGYEGEPPEEVTLACEIAKPAPAGRIQYSAFAGSGASVLPGRAVGCTVEVPRDGALRFGIALAPILWGLPGSDGNLLRVRLDGHVLFETRVSSGETTGCAWHEVSLPGGRGRARLVFEIEGELANVLLIDPRIGPREVGRRGARPWAKSRPDIVVFLADTFRADNMEVYGGPAGVTRHLDELARGGLCFLRAWSTAPWTVPSHASIFSGFYPSQVLASSPAQRLPEGVETVVERLERAGYRCGAVTGGGFVSSLFGFAQGFDYFREIAEGSEGLEKLLGEARAFLEADDGRPTFLFVQTYRTHWPYRVSERSRSELGERLGIRGEADELLNELTRIAREQGARLSRREAGEGLQRSARTAELTRQLHAHYLGAAADLDRAFGRFLEDLRASEVLDRGYLVFTSDHGEGFAEHDALFHARPPFEEQVRIPLLISGGGLPGRLVAQPASLVDLAPTFLAMAGSEVPPPDWPGRSLLGPGASRALYGFEFSGDPDDWLFVLEEHKKILCIPAEDEARLVGAYDLAMDAREEHDLAATDATWPGELLGKHTGPIRGILVPIVQNQRAELGTDKFEELRALGY